MITYVLVGVAAVLAVVFILSCMLHVNPTLRTLLKAIAGVGFVAVAVSAFISNPVNRLNFSLIMCGLLFGMAGDFLLAMREVKPRRQDAFTMAGIGAFLAGHIFYIILFYCIDSISFLAPVIAAVVGISIIVACKYVFKFEFGKLFIPACIYAVVIMYMLLCAIFVAITAYSIVTLHLLIGAVLFVISDLILSFIYFSPKKIAILGGFNLTSYFAAQILIALSLLYMF